MHPQPAFTKVTYLVVFEGKWKKHVYKIINVRYLFILYFSVAQEEEM